MPKSKWLFLLKKFFLCKKRKVSEEQQKQISVVFFLKETRSRKVIHIKTIGFQVEERSKNLCIHWQVVRVLEIIVFYVWKKNGELSSYYFLEG